MIVKNYDCKQFLSPLFIIPTALLIAALVAWLVLTQILTISRTQTITPVPTPEQTTIAKPSTRGLPPWTQDNATAHPYVTVPSQGQLTAPTNHHLKNGVITGPGATPLAPLALKERALHAVLKPRTKPCQGLTPGRCDTTSQQSQINLPSHDATTQKFSVARAALITSTDASVPTLVGTNSSSDVRLYSLRKKIRDHLLTSFRTTIRHASDIAREAYNLGRGAQFHVIINADGSLYCLKLIQSSGCEELDHAFASTFENAVPFPQIPESLNIKQYCISDVMEAE